jgi:hypothetical protein
VYALLAIVLLVIPYQITGSGFFVLALGGTLAALWFLARAGLALARPMTRGDALKTLHGARQSYYIAVGVGGLFVIVGAAELIDQADFTPLAAVNLVGTFLINAWILGVIATDQLIAALDRARLANKADGAAALADDASRQLATFMGPPGPPAA